jgi:hypothetical protein
VADPQRQPLTPRNAAWLVLRHSEHRDTVDANQMNRLQADMQHRLRQKSTQTIA